MKSVPSPTELNINHLVPHPVLTHAQADTVAELGAFAINDLPIEVLQTRAPNHNTRPRATVTYVRVGESTWTVDTEGRSTKMGPALAMAA